MKICTVCKEEKSLDRFYKYKNTKDGFSYRCKECDTKARHKYKAANREHVSKLNRNRMVRWRYKMEPEDYNKMVEKQNNVCAICDQSPINKPPFHTKLVIDHCHDTGFVRGLLCNKCNQALGLFQENIENIKRALKYLRKKKN